MSAKFVRLYLLVNFSAGFLIFTFAKHFFKEYRTLSILTAGTRTFYHFKRRFACPYPFLLIYLEIQISNYQQQASNSGVRGGARAVVLRIQLSALGVPSYASGFRVTFFRAKGKLPALCSELGAGVRRIELSLAFSLSLMGMSHVFCGYMCGIYQSRLCFAIAIRSKTYYGKLTEALNLWR